MRISKRLTEVGESATLEVARAADALRARGHHVVDLGIGEPDFATPKPVIDGAVAALEAGFTKYTANPGIAELRDAIARRYADECRGPFGREWVIVTAGAKHALFNAFMAVLDPGDEAIVPAPCWVSIPDQIRLVGATPVLVPARFESGFVPDPAAVERAATARTRAIVLNSPCNPTGAVLPAEVLGAIVEIARARDLYVVYDETYERFVYGEQPHVSAARFHAELGERLIVVNSFSKTYAMTGLRLGFLVGAPPLVRAANALQSHMTSNASSVSQKAALAALLGPQDAVAEMLKEYRRRRDRVIAALSGLDGVELAPPGGAFYAFPRVEGVMKRLGIAGSQALARHLLEEAKVALVPGAAFAAEGFLRLSFAARADVLEEGLVRLRRALE